MKKQQIDMLCNEI